MRKSAEVAADAMTKTIAATMSCSTESQLFATMDYHCRMSGAQHLAYPPVVACGDNANVIHYIGNTQTLEPGNELVLMDAGCEYNGYSSDITRTWPVSGRFSPPQRLIYDLVLDVQLKVLEKLAEMEETMTVDGLYNSMQLYLGQRLVGEGLVKGNDLKGADILGYVDGGGAIRDTAIAPRSGDFWCTYITSFQACLCLLSASRGPLPRYGRS